MSASRRTSSGGRGAGGCAAICLASILLLAGCGRPEDAAAAPDSRLAATRSGDPAPWPRDAEERRRTSRPRDRAAGAASTPAPAPPISIERSPPSVAPPTGAPDASSRPPRRRPDPRPRPQERGAELEAEATAEPRGEMAPRFPTLRLAVEGGSAILGPVAPDPRSRVGTSAPRAASTDDDDGEPYFGPIIGACCLYDGDCVEGATIADCVALRGVYLGHGTICDDGCPEMPGACCLGSAGCTVLRPSDCATAGGTALGAGTDCGSGIDADGDGAPAVCDACPYDAGKLDPGACGCGVLDDDTDGDGIPDCFDDCPTDPEKIEPGTCGCGVPDDDADDDGVSDCDDGCPLDPEKTAPGECGCGVPDDDTDGDGVLDCFDVCPLVADPAQEDCDDDGIGDACAGAPDCNANGIPDACDIAMNRSHDVNLNEVPDDCEGFRIEAGAIAADEDWTPVVFTNAFVEPVVVCSLQMVANTLPVVVRVRAITPFGFEVRLQNPSDLAIVADLVHWIAIEEGAWEEEDGLRCEARTITSTVVDSDGSWNGEAQTYLQAYLQPVVVGQVASQEDARFSYFWCRGPSTGDPPTAADLRVGKSVGEDPVTVRLDERLDWIVFEAGAGSLEGVEYEALLSTDFVAGMDNAPPYAVPFTAPFTAEPTIAAVSVAGMDGTNGGFAHLHGATLATTTHLYVAIDEDQLGDAERSHTTEQVGAVAFAVPFAVDGLPDPEIETEAELDPASPSLAPEPPAPSLDVDGDGAATALDLVAVLRALGECGTPCPADLDGDGVVTVLDAERFLRAW